MQKLLFEVVEQLLSGTVYILSLGCVNESVELWNDGNDSNEFLFITLVNSELRTTLAVES